MGVNVVLVVRISTIESCGVMAVLELLIIIVSHYSWVQHVRHKRLLCKQPCTVFEMTCREIKVFVLSDVMPVKFCWMKEKKTKKPAYASESIPYYTFKCLYP